MIFIIHFLQKDIKALINKGNITAYNTASSVLKKLVELKMLKTFKN